MGGHAIRRFAQCSRPAVILMKARRLVLLPAIVVVAIIIGGWIIQQLRLESREQPVTEADTEELGSYEHRHIALQEVRFIIEDATRDRQNTMILDALRHFRLPHRLMDFTLCSIGPLPEALSGLARVLRPGGTTSVPREQRCARQPGAALAAMVGTSASLCVRRPVSDAGHAFDGGGCRISTRAGRTQNT